MVIIAWNELHIICPTAQNTLPQNSLRISDILDFSINHFANAANLVNNIPPRTKLLNINILSYGPI